MPFIPGRYIFLHSVDANEFIIRMQCQEKSVVVVVVVVGVLLLLIIIIIIIIIIIQ